MILDAGRQDCAPVGLLVPCLMLVIYSCIVGNIDDPAWLLGSAAVPDPDVRYMLFTDQLEPGWWSATDCPAWEVFPLRITLDDPRRTARFHKTNAHLVLPPCAASVWLDGALRIRPGVQPKRDLTLDKHSIGSFLHPVRKCTYEELEACKFMKKDDPKLMNEQVRRYHAEGFPPNYGLAETTCLFRESSRDIRQLNALWWSEIDRGSVRDQLSLPYASWKIGLRLGVIAGYREQSPYFYFRQH